MAAAQLTVRANAEPSNSCVRAWGFHFKGLGWLCPCGSAACDGCLSLRLILLPVCSIPFTASRSGISEPLTLSRHPCRDCPATPAFGGSLRRQEDSPALSLSPPSSSTTWTCLPSSTQPPFIQLLCRSRKLLRPCFTPWTLIWVGLD